MAVLRCKQSESAYASASDERIVAQLPTWGRYFIAPELLVAASMFAISLLAGPVLAVIPSLIPSLAVAQMVIPEIPGEDPAGTTLERDKQQPPAEPTPASPPDAPVVEPQPAAPVVPAAQGAPPAEPTPIPSLVLRDTPFPAVFPTGWENFTNLDPARYLSVLEAINSCRGKLTLTGHTDAYGTEAANTALGRRRAQLVKEQLVADGVLEAHILLDSAGSSKPIGDNATEAGRLANRRVAITCNP